MASAPPPRRTTCALVVTIIVSALAAAAVTALLINIFERRQEARNPFFRVVELDDRTQDPAIWGKNFPFQYDSYRRTVDQQRTRYGGSEAVPRTPTNADPRTVVAQSRLEEDPRLRTMWAGYAFSRDFREERGHAYMLTDQEFTERQQAVKQPGACLNCHASTYTTMMELGAGNLEDGFAKMNALPFSEARKQVTHPVACIDCHDPQTMALRITRPAFIEGLRVLKASQGVQNFDVARDATRQEMRTYVCAQCHVEYYFKGPERRLTFPWHNGLMPENMLAYYDEQGFSDWKHTETGAPVLKAQHPEFEMWSRGIHARSGVSCTDCHMPYERVGGTKVSDHHVRSPVLNINRACQGCHRWSEDELKQRVESIQTRTYNMRNDAMDALIELIEDIKAARAGGAPDTSLAAARDFQRKAQFFLDFVEAENSMGFHAPEEAARILADSINFTRQGQVALRDGKVRVPASQAHPDAPKALPPPPGAVVGGSLSGAGESTPSAPADKSAPAKAEPAKVDPAKTDTGKADPAQSGASPAK